VADPDQVNLLKKKGVKGWNTWRQANPETEVDLRNASLMGVMLGAAYLSGANLSGADLRFADLSGAYLDDANLVRANLSGADLRLSFLIRANLENAELTGADFYSATLSDTNLSKCVMQGVELGDLDLSQCKDLESVKHLGPSSIGIDTIYRSGGKIPEVFLRGAGVPEPFIVQMKALVAAMSPIEFYSCFISYSAKDHEFAERLHADLRSKNVRCWFAPEDLKIGDKLRPSFDEAIRVHDKLMVLLSENSVSSQWVEKEVETAFEKERREKRTVLFPIRLDDAVMETNEAWAADIRRTRHIGDFRAWKNHDSYKKAFERLLRDLKAEG
jgi:uncharacterized protein YjbI with pentapeptide repeats